MIYKSEADLVSELRSSVSELWGSEATSRIEVRCHDQASMDLLVIAPTGLIAVEAKLSHWNRVIVQAFLHRYCVDLVYIAVPENTVTKSRLLEAAQFNLGVIAIANGSTRIVQEAGRAQPTGRIRRRILELSSNDAALERSI